VSGGAGDGSRPGRVVRRRALVSGRVQGVFFRDSTRQLAASRGVAGRAWNLPDGRVEVVLEGPPGEVTAVLAWLRQGPAYARVETVEVTEEPVEGLRGFEIG
jgi:acylphosphatase